MVNDMLVNSMVLCISSHVSPMYVNGLHPMKYINYFRHLSIHKCKHVQYTEIQASKRLIVISRHLFAVTCDHSPREHMP